MLVLSAICLVLMCAGVCGNICEVKNQSAICQGTVEIDIDATGIEKIQILNRIETFGSENFTNFLNLQSIDLSNTGLQELDKNSFIKNEKLEEINLSFNSDLQILTNESLLSSNSVKRLNLSHINIEELSSTVFEDLPNLEILDLTTTNIKNYSFLSNLQNLKTLLISESSSIDTKLICKDTTNLQQIIEIKNNKQMIYNCTQNLTIVETNEQQGPQNTKEEKTTEKTVENTDPSTEIPKTVTTEEIPNLNKSETTPESPENPPEVLEQTENSTEATNLEISSPAENLLDTTTEILESGITIILEPEEINKRVLNVSEKIQEKPQVTETGNRHAESSENDTRSIGAEAVQPSPTTTSGTNIVLGIVLCVMIVGAVGFGFKYWKKNRQGYQNANTEDVEFGKELQDMSARPINNTTEQNTN